LNQSRQNLYRDVQTIEESVSGTRNQMNSITAKVQKVKQFAEKIRKKESDLVALNRREINIPEERIKYKAKVDNLIAKLLNANSNVAKALEKFSKFCVQREIAHKKYAAFDDSTDNIDRQIEELQKDIRQVQQTQTLARHSSDCSKRRMDAKEEEALKLTDGSRPKSSNFKFKEKFAKIPNTIEEIQTSMNEMQGRMECIKGVDKHILVEFEKRKETILQLQNQLEKERSDAIELENQLERLHQIWYPKIQNVVETINKNFSDFFSKMGFVGEVDLIRKEEREYASYGIQIRVQYRDNEKLQALNRHVQSGGERAVAIAVYTLSLQHLTSVPFRCVDEINQGMDPSNERKIFQMLVDITCQEGQSQYFFVTPKLLSDLPYSDLMCITVVHNGKYIEDPYVLLDSSQEGDVSNVMEEVIDTNDYVEMF
jgi:structural maintenance of chromosomes protein 5